MEFIIPWIMTVPKGTNLLSAYDKSALLVLTERKTRYELIFKVKNHGSLEVIRILDYLERKEGKRFKSIFKTITVDNGSEFSDFNGMERSIKPGEKRTNIFYCHPYSSFERGSNENQNKLIRRHYPKGTCFKNVSLKDIKRVQEWLNNYPRKMFNWRSSAVLYAEEMLKI